jgi:aryl carrier-like protein
VEAALGRLAGVRDAVAAVRGDGVDARLVAYVVTDVAVERLAVGLAEQLPAYMQPAAWVVLDRLPLTANGKVDRQALPAPVFAAREHVAPADATEAAIAEVWQELLGVERVGRDDHFFELGGHSLLVITLIERLRRRGLAVDARAVFTTPTLAALAATAGRVDAAAAEWTAPANLIPSDYADAAHDADAEEFSL